MITKLEQYLNQQKQQFGNALYFENSNQSIDNARSKQSQTIATDQLKKETRTFKPPTSSKSLLGKSPVWEHAETLAELDNQIHDCMNCPLGATRTKFVFGVGNPNADIVVIGEAPGADEDAQGEPFVGRAGQLLTKILEAINFKRDEVYICNILKCRPPNNRTPVKEEVDECEPYLYKQLDLIQPKFILAVGLTAVNTLLREKFKMADVRGRFLDYHGARLLVTYHPAALLRNPEWKKFTWEDVQLLRTSYDDYIRTDVLPEVNDRGLR